jgi:hypothetical protein
MPLIECVAPYRNGADEWRKGHVEDVSSEVAAFLLRDSPGSFCVVSSGAVEVIASPADPDVDMSAMSTQTAWGADVPDRRARGGRRR